MAVSVYIVEDNPLVRESTAEFVSAIGDYNVCGWAPSAEEALEQMDAIDVDLALIDLSLPGMDGIELIEDIRQRWPDTCCLIFSGHGESTYVERALDAGSCGYVLKGNPTELIEALPAVLNGEEFVSDKIKRAP